MSAAAAARRRRIGARSDGRTGYARLLRLHHLNPGFYLSLLLFEGSIGVAILLALADVIDAWGVLVVPVSVAVMVKLNDVVAGLLARPAAEAQLRRSGSTPVVVGRSPVPRPSRLTQWIDRDDAVPYHPLADEEAGGRGAVARGVAAVPEARERPPSPGVPAQHASIEAVPPAVELTAPEPAVPEVDSPAVPVDSPAVDSPAGTETPDAGTEPPGRGNVGRFFR
jgi:hypothetical protein